MKINRKQQDVTGKLIAIIGLLLGTFSAGFPIFWMICSPFKLNSEIFAFPPEIITRSLSFDTYVPIFKDSERLRFFANSYFIAGTMATLTLLVAILTSYALNRYEFPGKRIINTFIISVQAIPPITLSIPYLGSMVALKLYNIYQGLIFIYMMLTLPYTITMLAGYFNTLPRGLDEAARVDGGTSFRTLWRILVPISIPGTSSVVIYTFMIA